MSEHHNTQEENPTNVILWGLFGFADQTERQLHVLLCFLEKTGLRQLPDTERQCLREPAPSSLPCCLRTGHRSREDWPTVCSLRTVTFSKSQLLTALFIYKLIINQNQ